MELFITILGYICAGFTVSMYIPQSIKIMKLKSAKGLSKITFPALFVAFIIFVNWAPLTGLWQLWAANMPLIIIALPILYYMFHKEKVKFIVFAFLGGASIAISLIQFLYPLPTNDIVSTTMSLSGSIIIAIVFWPQTWIVVKNKNIGNLSIMTICLILLTSVLWITFYIGNIVHNGVDVALLIQLISVILGMLTQLPMVYFYFKNLKNKKHYIVKK